MPGAQSAARFRAHLVVLAMLVAAYCCIAGAQAPSAHAYGSALGSFEIDGNLADDSGAGEPIDWASPPPNLNNFTDGSGKNDDGFGLGSKETEPSGWTCIKQSAPGKDDIVSGQIAFRIFEGKQYAYVNYFRKAVTGDAHIDYEFNRSTIANPACPATPARSDGDFVITFDTENGGKFIFVKLQRWNAATSSFSLIETANLADGAVNIPANGGLSIPGHKNGDFGEAVINLTDTIGEVTCGEFSTAYMKSRSSTSIDSALQDRTSTKPLNVGLCPQSTLTKGVRNQTTNPTGAYTATTTAKPGDRISYQVTYKNTGSATATNVVIKDTLAPRQTLVASTCVAPACTYDEASRTLTWTFDAVGPGATRTVTFEVTLDATFPSGTTDIKNSSVVTTTEEGPTPKTSNETTVTVTSAPKSEPSKTARNITTDGAAGTTISASPGDTIEYTLVYKNAGTSTAENVVLSDPIPNKTTFVSCSDSCTKVGDPVSEVRWTLASVQPGETVTRSFRVKLDDTFPAGSTTAVTNVATACIGTNCVSTPPVTVNVRTPSSSTDKAVRVLPDGTFANTASARPGDSLEYRLVYTNSGPGDARDVTLSDEIADGQTLISCSDSCDSTTTPGTVTWSFGTVPAGATRTVTFIVKLDDTFPSGTTTIENVAVAKTREEGEKPSDKTTVTVTAKPDLKLVKSASSPTSGKAVAGEEITYTLAYRNDGDATAAGTTIDEAVPPGTEYVSCSPSCSTTGTPVSSVTFAIGAVPPGGSGTVTLTVRVRNDVGCTVCNTARIKSPSQDNGAAVNSNQVCLTGVPGPNPAGANASGNATGLVVRSDGISLLGTGLVPAIDERLSDVSSVQHGVGSDGRSASLLSVPAPASSLVTADVIRGTTASSVTESPARARSTSTATTADVNVLTGAVTAEVVNAAAQATATGDASSVSAAGTKTVGLVVDGVNRDNAPPNTTVNVDVVGMTGVTVTINEQIVTTSGPSPGQASAGTYRARIEVNGVHVRVADADLTKGGKQPIDIIVSHAVADADFPQTRLCETAPLRSVSGHAFIASVKTAPNVVDIVHGFAGIPTSGGSDYQSAADVSVDDTGGLVDADAAESSSTGTVTTLGASATSYAQAANVCVIAPTMPGCVVSATLVRSQSSSSASGTGRSSNATGTTLQNVTVAGSTVPIPLDPAPNTVIPLPGIGTLVLNEQIPDAPETGHTGLTVRALHLTLLDPAAGPLGAEVIVAEAHSDARFVP